MAATNIRKGRDKPARPKRLKRHAHVFDGSCHWCRVKGCDFWWDGVAWVEQ